MTGDGGTTNGATAGGEVAAGSASTAQDRLVADLLVLLNRWTPREMVGFFRHWHRDALSMIHLNVLAVLEAEGPLSMSRLAEALDVSVASATGIADRLEARGLVERRHATDDRRVVVVHLTDTGGKVFTSLEDDRRERLGKMLLLLTETELRGFLDGIQALDRARKTLFSQPTAGTWFGRTHHFGFASGPAAESTTADGPAGSVALPETTP